MNKSLMEKWRNHMTTHAFLAAAWVSNVAFSEETANFVPLCNQVC